MLQKQYNIETWIKNIGRIKNLGRVLITKNDLILKTIMF